MKVRFRLPWFGPQANYFAAGVQEVPASYRPDLPSTAVVLDKEGAQGDLFKAPEVVKEDLFKDHDTERAAQDEKVRVETEAEASRVAHLEKVAADFRAAQEAEASSKKKK